MGVIGNINKTWYFYYQHERGRMGVGRYRSEAKFILGVVREAADYEPVAMAKLECRGVQPIKNILFDDRQESYPDFVRRAERWAAEVERQCKKELEVGWCRI